MIIFGVESIKEIHLEMKDLLQLHYDELIKRQDVIQLNPDWPRYKTLEDLGEFVLFTARKDQSLIGYSAFFLDHHIHYKELLVARNDVIFLHKDHRLGTTGVRLIQFSEEKLVSLGARKISWHIKPSNDFSPILHRYGYTDDEKIVSKLI